MPAWAWRLARGTMLGLAAFALVADLLLLAGGSVSRWWLPLCLVLGVCVGNLGAPLNVSAVDAAPRWLRRATFAIVALVTFALAYGAIATCSRDWDGVVTWGLKAAVLTAQPSLAQPFFADPQVLHHSASYPLLQPLCLASLGQWLGAAPARGFFPAVYVLLVLFVGGAVVRYTGSRALGCWCALGVGLVPELIGAGAGSVDSGYADAFHALVLTAAAVALLLGDAPLLCAAAVTLPFVKPEGTVHAVLLAGVALARAPRAARITVVLGVAASLSVALPLQARLGHASPPGGVALAAPWVVALVALGLRGRVAGRVRRRVVWSVGAVGAGVAVAVLVLAKPMLVASGQVLLAQYLGRLDGVAAKLPHTPTILLGVVQAATSPRLFGATFALLVALAWTARAHRVTVERSLTLFLALAGCALLSAFYLSPEPDVSHHLRSSAPRLLLQLAGAVWIVLGATLPVGVAPGNQPHWLRHVLGAGAQPPAGQRQSVLSAESAIARCSDR